MSDVVFGKWFENADGTELYVELTCRFVPHRAATHFDPAEGGLEADSIRIDGGPDLPIGAEHERMVDSILDDNAGYRPDRSDEIDHAYDVYRDRRLAP